MTILKVIALLPVKNEAWILPTYLSTVGKIADEIIVLDDASTDNSANLLNHAGAHVVSFPSAPGKVLPMSVRRKELLRLGREQGGTHFIWLDADESFTSQFIPTSREYIERLQPGEKLALRWIALWKSSEMYNTGPVWGNIYKDFIVCDKSGLDFDDALFSEARTQGENKENVWRKLDIDAGAVLHFQFVLWERFQMKQAWYRCAELIAAPHAAKAINATYSITLDETEPCLKNIDKSWIEDVAIPQGFDDIALSWHYTAILDWFDQYGITYFEPLQIWHISRLHNAFVKNVGKPPRSWSDDSLINKVKRIAQRAWQFRN